MKPLIPFAIRTGKLDVLKLLVANGCRINDSMDFVLHEAATMDRIDVVKFLLESFSNGLDVNSVNREIVTARFFVILFLIILCVLIYACM